MWQRVRDDVLAPAENFSARDNLDEDEAIKWGRKLFPGFEHGTCNLTTHDKP